MVDVSKIVCRVCEAKTGERCSHADGSLLPVGQIHDARRKALAGIDCLPCNQRDQ